MKFTSFRIPLLVAMIGFYRIAASAAPTARARAFGAAQKSLKSRTLTQQTRSTVSKATAPSNVEVSALSKIMSFPKDQPFVFQLIIATLKTTAADLVVQLVAEGKSFSEVDWRRNGIFVVFGFSYLGGFQYYLMVNKYRQWFPTMDKFAKMSLAEKLKWPAGMFDAGKMVLFDIVVHLPLLYFPTYYTVKEFVSGNTWNPLDWAQDGVAKYAKNAKEDLTAMVQVWGPSDCIQFMLPVHMRLPFRHIISFFWTAYVSFTRGSIKHAQATPTPTAE